MKESTSSHTHNNWSQNGTHNNGSIPSTHTLSCKEDGCNETKVEECVFTPVVTYPTTESNGYTTFTCSKCGYSYKADTTPHYGQYIMYGSNANHTDWVELTGINTIGTATTVGSRLLGGTYILTLAEGAETGTYVIKTNDGKYLAWKSKNTLITVEESEKNENTSLWKINIADNCTYSIINYSTLTNEDSTDDRRLQYNSGDPRFACYTSSQQPPMLMCVDNVNVQMSLTTESTDNGAIILNYYVQAPDLAEAKLSSSFGTEVKYTEAGTLTPYGYKVSYAVPMKNFKDNVTLKLFDANTDAIGELNGYAYNVQSYLEAASSFTGTAKGLIDSIGYIGRMAEALFDHNEATDISTIEETINTAFAPFTNTGTYSSGTYYNSVTVTDAGGNFLGTSLILEDQVTLRFYFKVGGDGYSVTVDNKSAELKSKNGEYYCDITNIAAKNLNASHTVVLKNGDNTVVSISGFSPLTYATQAIRASETSELGYLCKALFIYQTAAKAYFG